MSAARGSPPGLDLRRCEAGDLLRERMGERLSCSTDDRIPGEWRPAVAYMLYTLVRGGGVVSPRPPEDRSSPAPPGWFCRRAAAIRVSMLGMR